MIIPTSAFFSAAFFSGHGFLLQFAQKMTTFLLPASSCNAIEKAELTSIHFCPHPGGFKQGKLGLFSGLHSRTRLSVPACYYLFRLAKRACRRSRILASPASILRSCKARDALISPVSSSLPALNVGFFVSSREVMGIFGIFSE